MFPLLERSGSVENNSSPARNFFLIIKSGKWIPFFPLFVIHRLSALKLSFRKCPFDATDKHSGPALCRRKVTSLIFQVLNVTIYFFRHYCIVSTGEAERPTEYLSFWRCKHIPFCHQDSCLKIGQYS